MSGKGSGFEREQCRAWSLWASGGESEDWFWRTQGSGGRATNTRIGRLRNQYGDMTHTEEGGRPFTDSILFEFKRGYGKAARIRLEDIHQIVSGSAGKKSTEEISKALRKYLSRQSTASELGVLDILDSGKKVKKLEEWVTTAQRDMALGRRKTFLIIFKRDSKQACILMQTSLFYALAASCYCDIEPRITITSADSVTILRLEDFFKWAGPKDLLAAVEITPAIPRVKN